MFHMGKSLCCWSNFGQGRMRDPHPGPRPQAPPPVIPLHSCTPLSPAQLSIFHLIPALGGGEGEQQRAIRKLCCAALLKLDPTALLPGPRLPILLGPPHCSQAPPPESGRSVKLLLLIARVAAASKASAGPSPTCTFEASAASPLPSIFLCPGHVPAPPCFNSE